MWTHVGAAAPMAKVEFCVAGGGARIALMGMLGEGFAHAWSAGCGRWRSWDGGAGEGGGGVCAAGVADLEWDGGECSGGDGGGAGGGAGEDFAWVRVGLRLFEVGMQCGVLRQPTQNASLAKDGEHFAGDGVALAVMMGCHGAAREPGTVVVIMESSPNNLDPRQGTDAQSERVGALIFDALVKKDEHYNLVPWLATSWEQPDALTWVFHLRDGVRFQDGRPLEAADVVWTIESLIDPKLGLISSEERELWERRPAWRRATG